MLVQRDLLLSIVVPTRNRAQYAIPMIKSILDLDGSVFELVISDNSDNNLLEEWVRAQKSDPRLRYERVSEPLSMTQNHNCAFARARGEYICLIGDDDTVLPSIVAACEWARAEDIDAITPDTPLRYCWPDLRSRYWGAGQAGKLFMDPWELRVWKGQPADESLACSLRAGQGSGWLPKVYHGVVRRRCLEALREATGAYCYSVSPDVYLALSLAPYVRRQACTNAPLTIPGASGGSNSGRAAMRRHKGDLRKDPHMIRFAAEEWPLGVPCFFSVETVWAQAALEAIRRGDSKDLANAFNFSMLYVLCFIGHMDYRKEILDSFRALKVERRGGGIGWVDLLREGGRELGRRGAYYLRRLTRPTPRGFSVEFGPYEEIQIAKTDILRRFEPILSWPCSVSWSVLGTEQNAS